MTKEDEVTDNKGSFFSSLLGLYRNIFWSQQKACGNLRAMSTNLRKSNNDKWLTISYFGS